MASKIISTQHLARALKDAGVLPDKCKRFVIDSGPPDGIPMLYFECYGDDRLLELLTGPVGIQVIQQARNPAEEPAETEQP